MKRSMATILIGCVSMTGVYAGEDDPHLALARKRIEEARAALQERQYPEALLKLREAWADGLRWAPEGTERAAAESRLDAEIRIHADTWPPLLSGATAEIRRAAAWAMGRVKEKRFLEHLAKRLSEEGEPVVRVELVRALSAGEHLEAAPVLDRCREDPMADVRAEAVTGLAHIHPPQFVATVRKMLQDPAPEVRRAVLEALGTYAVRPDPEGAEAREGMAEALGDADLSVRKRAVELAAAPHDEKLLRALIRSLSDERNREHPDLRLAVVGILIEQRTKDAAQALLLARSDPDDTVAIKAIEGLGRQARDYAEIPPILIALAAAPVFGPDADARTRASTRARRCAAFRALGAAPHALASVKALTSALTEPDLDTIHAALSGLTLLAAKEALPDVRKLAEHAEDVLAPAVAPARLALDARRVRREAVLTAARLGDRAPIRFVLIELANADPAVRADAALFIGRLGLPQGIPVLIDLLDSPEEPIRKQAVSALDYLTHRDWGFRSDADENDRRAAVKRFQIWWLNVFSEIRLKADLIPES